MMAVVDPFAFRSVPVARSARPQPRILHGRRGCLHGTGAGTAKRLGISELLLSISHSEHYAVANALALGA